MSRTYGRGEGRAKRYSNEERSDILAHADQHGVPSAVEKYSTTEQSIRAWRRKAKKKSNPAAPSAKRVIRQS